MAERTWENVRDCPALGDVIEITERRKDDHDGTEFDFEVMLRIVAFREERVWFKEYGKGHRLIALKEWKERLNQASARKIVRDAYQDCPF